jgi:hypothetical protein
MTKRQRQIADVEHVLDGGKDFTITDWSDGSYLVEAHTTRARAFLRRNWTANSDTVTIDQRDMGDIENEIEIHGWTVKQW